MILHLVTFDTDSAMMVVSRRVLFINNYGVWFSGFNYYYYSVSVNIKISEYLFLYPYSLKLTICLSCNGDNNLSAGYTKSYRSRCCFWFGNRVLNMNPCFGFPFHNSVRSSYSLNSGKLQM